MAEMAERAQAISQEAGTKIAAAMKDVIGTAAGIAGFAVESARDLVQYMVRRGQMTQDEADRIIKEAEEAHGRRTRASGVKPAAERPATKAERPRESAAREEPVKPSSSSAKRTSGATAQAKSGKKAAAKPASAPKKERPASKPGAPKKRR